LGLLKRRACLFGITFLYSRGCKFFIEFIQYDPTNTHSMSFMEVICLQSTDTLMLVHLSAMIFGQRR
jgi:hypothetical protein